jgi:hypothetical protein
MLGTPEHTGGAGGGAVPAPAIPNHAVALGLFLRQPARFDILSRRVPALGGGAEEEGEAREAIARRLGDLNGSIGDFRAGLELMKLAEAHAAFQRSWAPIACRDAARALINFRAALKAIGEAVKESRALKRVPRGLKPVERRFAADFPIARARRTARLAAAGAPLVRRHDDMCDAVIAAHVSHAGRRVRHASDGRELRFELSEHSLWQLVALRDAAFAAFEEA